MKIKNIIKKKIIGDLLSDCEEEILQEWLNNSPSNEKIFERLKTFELSKLILTVEDEGLGREMANDFRASINKIRAQRRRTIATKIAYTVSVAAILAISFLIYNDFGDKQIGVIIRKEIALSEITDSNNSIRLITDNKVLNLDNKGFSEEKRDIKREENRISFNHQNDTTATDHPQIDTLIVPLKREYNFVLPDGSRVWVNSGSKLMFPEKFSDTLRCVELIGEAYFEIVRNEKAPFVVKTQTMSTRVLGTEFMVSSYEDKNEVALVEGSVMVNKNGSAQNVTLKPGRGVVLSKNAKELREMDINIGKIIERKNGFLLFDEERLGDIVLDLKHWYGVDFIFEEDGLKDMTFYIRINRRDSIQYIMQLLKFTKKINYSIDGEKVIIKSCVPMMK